jgi:hypothetical protein
MQTKVEEPTLLFAQPEIKWTPSKPGSVKLLLKANYTIQGLAEMRDYEDNLYLTPLPVIEIDQISDEFAPTEHEQRHYSGTYTIEREVEKPTSEIGVGPKSGFYPKWEVEPKAGVTRLYSGGAGPPAGSAIRGPAGARFANGLPCSSAPSSPSLADEYDRALREDGKPTAEQMAAAGMRYMGGRGVAAPPCQPGPIRWTVSVQLYGYPAVEKTVLLQGLPEGTAPPPPVQGGGSNEEPPEAPAPGRDVP